MGYEQQPGMTGSTSSGGQYDNLDTVNSNNYTIKAAEDAAAANLSAERAAVSSAEADDFASAAAISAENALSSSTAASVSAADALASAVNSENSAVTSTAQADIATTQAGIATNKADIATNKADIATTQAGIATTQAGIAVDSATSAGDSLAATQAIFDDFDDIYLGKKAADPTVDNDGNPLMEGALYFNTVSKLMKVYEGSTWLISYASLSGALLASNNLSELSNVADARDNLGLTSIVTTEVSDYATAAQGDTADSAAQPTTSNTFTANQTIEVTDNTNAALRITQLGTGNALLVEDSSNPDSTPFVIDASGNTIKGYTSTFDTVYVSGAATTPGFEVLGTNLGTSSMGLYNFSTATSSAVYSINKSRSGAVGTHTIVQSGDTLGALLFTGSDGTGYIASAYIAAAVDGTPGTNDMPGRLVFSTTADGALAPTERMRITNNGYVGINNTNPTVPLDVTGSALITATDASNASLKLVQASTGEVLRLKNSANATPILAFENSDTTADGNTIYGSLQFFGSDTSAGAAGLQAKIEAESRGTGGGADLNFYVTISADRTPLKIGYFKADATGLSTLGHFFTEEIRSPSINDETHLYGTVSMANTDTTADVDLTTYLNPSTNGTNLVRVYVTGIYDSGASTYARLHKTWEQTVYWSGTAFVIAGAALNTSYNSDATNFPAGAVNAAKVASVASATSFVLRFTNRTTPAAASNTQFKWRVAITKI